MNTEVDASTGVDANTEVDANTDSNASASQTSPRQNSSTNTPEYMRKVRLTQSVLDSLPIFTGDDLPYDASKWLAVLCGAAILYRWSEATKLRATLAKLKGPAYQWQIGRIFKSWFDFEEQFNTTYVEKMNVLIGRIQGKSEYVLDYYQDKIEICRELELTIDDAKEQLLDGMRTHEKGLIKFLSTRSHHNEQSLLIDIMDYLSIIEYHGRLLEYRLINLPKTDDRHSTRNANNQEINIYIEPSFVTQQADRPRKHQLTQGPKDGKRQMQKRSRDKSFEGTMYLEPAYNVRLGVQYSNHSIVVKALIDSGSPISLIKSRCVGKQDRLPFNNNISISGINGSQLNIKGVLIVNVVLLDYYISKKQIFYAVQDDTMSVECLLGRDFINGFVISFGMEGNMMLNVQEECSSSDIFLQELRLIKYNQGKEIELNIGEVSFQDTCKLRTMYREFYLKAEKPKFPEVDYEVTINLKDQTPFKYQPQLLSYSEKNVLKDIIFDLLIKGIIKESRSEFCSPIILAKKKDSSYRMCPDLRELNKKVMKEQNLQTNIDDLLNNLSGKKYFTKLILKKPFFKVAHQSSKYLSFSTFLGQYEYVRLPFVYCNSSSAFMRFVNLVFKELILHGKLLVYSDDLLIATETKEENLEIIKFVLIICNKNLLELREDKCFFLKSKITYLGYLIDSQGVTPDSNMKKVSRFPISKATGANVQVIPNITKKKLKSSNPVFLMYKKVFSRRK